MLIRISLIVMASILFGNLTLYCYAQGQNGNQVARKVDEYIAADFNDHKAHIDRFVDELNKEPNARAYIIAYDARVSRYGDTRARGEAGSAEFFLVHRRDGGISPDHIVIIEGGLREQQDIELYIVPRGARPPTPMPMYQSSEAIYCPLIDTNRSMYVWDINRPLKFGIWIREDKTKVVPTFRWTVSSGEIMNGQGTSDISVKLPKSQYQSITATVEVGGYSPECQTRATVISTSSLTKFPYKFDGYGNIGWEDEEARIDNYAISLMVEPTLQAYVIIYGGRHGRRGEAQARAARAKGYLTKQRGINRERITIINGGYREDLTIELWLNPRGEKAPLPMPTITSRDIVFKDALRHKHPRNGR